MAGPAGGRRSGHGIDRTVLEAGVGNVGAVLEARAPAAGGSQPDVRYAAPVPSQEQPRAAREKERFPRRRKVTRRKHQLTRAKVVYKNQLESLLEQAHLKLSSFVSDLLGLSARRMLKALAEGETDPAVLAAMADCRLRATPEQLRDALGACTQLNGVFRRLLKMALEELELIETHIEQLEREAMGLMQEHQDAVQRVAEVPGFGLDSAMQMIAEVGPKATAFEVAKALSSWVGVCPGNEESAGESHSTRSPKGNHHMRRLLDQAAQSAVKVKGSIFELTFHRLLPRLGYP